MSLSKYLEAIAKIDGYDAIMKVAGAVQTGLEAGDVNGALDALKSAIQGNNPLNENQYMPSQLNRHGQSTDTPDTFTSNNAFMYPANLFENGNAPYILFYMKDSYWASAAANSGSGAYDKFAGSDAKPDSRIALYMPPSVKVNYGAKWEDSNLKVHMAGEAIKAALNGTLPQSAIDQAKAKAIDTVFQTDGAFSDDSQFQSKSIVDPKNALLFKGVNFRTFQFDFQLMARNADESESIRKIIKAFKYAMHPGYSGGGSGGDDIMWSYPHFFEIYLCTPERKFMFNIMNAALTDMDVDYGGSGVASFFRQNGAPVDIRLSLTFKELFVLTKDLILQDY